jgi:hypothetical protein
MTRRLTRAFRAAVREARTTITELAEASGYSRITFDLYTNQRAPSRDAALALADELERRSKRLAEHAARIRGAAADDPVDGGTSA